MVLGGAGAKRTGCANVGSMSAGSRTVSRREALSERRHGGSVSHSLRVGPRLIQKHSQDREVLNRNAEDRSQDILVDRRGRKFVEDSFGKLGAGPTCDAPPALELTGNSIAGERPRDSLGDAKPDGLHVG